MLAVLSRTVRGNTLRLTRRAYHQNIIDHYETPRNVGAFDQNDPDVGTGLVGAPACGDVMKLQLRVGTDGKVEEAVFKVEESRGHAMSPRLDLCRTRTMRP